jgi:hypothetical protein
MKPSAQSMLRSALTHPTNNCVSLLKLTFLLQNLTNLIDKRGQIPVSAGETTTGTIFWDDN